MSAPVPNDRPVSRPILFTLLAITSVLVIAAIAVLLALVVGPPPSVVIADPNSPQTTAAARPTPTPTPDPTVTITVTSGSNSSSAPAITGFTITPTPADCGDPVTAATVPLHVKWTSTGAEKATLAINGGVLPFSLPASGDDGDIAAHFSSFAFDCGEAYEFFTLTVSKGTQSAREIIFVAREFNNIH